MSHTEEATNAAAVVQRVCSDGSSQTAALASGTQNVFIGALPTAPQVAAVSVTPPLGRRDPARPLRGRAQLIAKLDALLSGENGGTKVHVVHGLGGSGKTAFALELAAAAQARATKVWWINAGDGALLAAGMHAVARQVGATDAELNQGNASDVLWSHLQRFPDHWLLVLDNADNPSMLGGVESSLADGTGWIRPTVPDRGGVLVTSRDATPESWGSWCEFHLMDMLDSDDGAQVLLDHTGGRAGSKEEAAALSVALGGLPLALRIAGSYLAETTSSPWPESGAVTTFSQYSQTIVGDSFPPPGGEQLIERIWQLAITLLENRGLHEAALLLELTASFADAPIPYRAVLDPELLSSLPVFSGIDGTRLWRSLQALSNLAMVDLTYPSASDASGATLVLRVHPLVRHAARRSSNPDNRGFYIAHATLAMAVVASRESPELPANWPLWQYLTPHAIYFVHLLDSAGAPNELIAAASRAALAAVSYLEARGLYQQAEAELRAIIAVQQRRLGDEDTLAMESHHRLGHLLSERGNFEEAQREHVAILAVARRAKGEEDPYTLNLRQCLGVLLAMAGKYEEAEDEQRLALNIARRALGEDHSQTLNIRHNLGHTLKARGKLSEASSEHVAVIEAQVRTKGPEHPDTLKTRKCHALILEDLGQYNEAERELKELTLVQEHIFGEDNLAAVESRASYAGFLKRRRKFPEAMDEYQRVIAARRRVLGDHHRFTLSARHYFADVLSAADNLDQAEAEHRSVLESEQQILGDEHPETLLTRYCLANLLSRRGEHEAAAAEYRVVINGRSLVLGPSHPETLQARHSLAHLLDEQGQHEEAMAAHQAVLTIEESTLGADNPKTLRMRSCFASFLLENGKPEEAKREFEIALEGRKRVFGADHPLTASIQHVLDRINAAKL
ncbi:FxSxx-COOH system tetratricopeptide repeat protein [Micromonospora aurantiaca (nom. illeg.)]|uniref:FxSxx-COOH system tetratricopeptide repeat protein n=1 Tax=Micromonospora aurantiaca (nom. illeg.) TaxID=47850 RepID=UPI003EBE6932